MLFIDIHSCAAVIKARRLAYLNFTQGRAPNYGNAGDVHMEDSA